MEELQVTNTYVKEDANGCLLFLRTFAHQGKDVTCMIQLRAASERRLRTLGYVTLNDNVFHVKRDRAKHLHNFSKSYGFNAEVLSDKTFFDIQNVHLVEDGTIHYVIPIHVIERHGSWLHFKNQGFEKQRFVRLETIQLFKVEQYATEYSVAANGNEESV